MTNDERGAKQQIDDDPVTEEWLRLIAPSHVSRFAPGKAAAYLPTNATGLAVTIYYDGRVEINLETAIMCANRDQVLTLCDVLGIELKGER